MSKKISVSKVALGLSFATISGLSITNLASAASIEVDQCNSLQSTISAAENDDTIVLGLSCTKDIIIAEGQSLTIDLAGNILSTYGNTDVITVESGASLVLTDSVGGGSVKAGNPGYNALLNGGTTNAKDLIIWGDIKNSGNLNLEGVTLDPEDYYPFQTYTINNAGGALTTSGDAAKNLFKSTPIENVGGTVELTAATFDVEPNSDFIPEGYEVKEVNGKYVISAKVVTPEEDPTDNTNPNGENIINEEGGEDNYFEDPAYVDPLGETYTQAGVTPSVPNTGDKEDGKEVTSTSTVDLLLFALAFSFTGLLIAVIIKSRHSAATEEIIY